MGYSYGMSGRLSCDNCGVDSGIRKRTCKYTVTDEGTTLPYCPPPAYCAACFKLRGGTAGIHGDSCRDGAAHSQRVADEKAARIASGDLAVTSAFGDWLAGVPKGFCLVIFRAGRASVDEVYRLIPKSDYRTGGFLSDYPTAIATDIRP